MQIYIQIYYEKYYNIKYYKNMERETEMGYKILSHIGTALGNNKVNNDYFLQQMLEENREKGKHFFEDIMGRDIRYIADENQTSLTLAVDASKEAIDCNKVNVEEVGLVICISQTPEYTSPTMARMVVEAIGAKETTNCFDMNANCTGMMEALDLADRYFRTDSQMKYILLVQGDRNSSYHTETTSPFFGCLSDIGCAVILERDEERGIQSRHFLLSNAESKNIVYPKEGYSKPNPVLYVQPDTDPGVEAMTEHIQELYGEERLKNMDLLCISQFAYINWKRFVDTAQVDPEKVPYVGNKYGYTGASSPLFALKQAVESGKVKRGATILFWTYGAGYLHGILEIKY